MKKKNENRNIKYIVISIILTIVAAFNIAIYMVDRSVMPRALELGAAEMKSKMIYMINSNVKDVFGEEPVYDELVSIERDSDGNITMIKTNTSKMNEMSSKASMNIQDNIEEIKKLGLKVPLGYVIHNNIISSYGPSIDVKIRPIDEVSVSYESDFQSAGINQTRHRIYLKVKTRIAVNTAFLTQNEDVDTEIPIVENIIVGKVPQTAINIGK